MRTLVPALRRATGAIVLAHAIKTVFALLALGQLGLELSHLAATGDLIAQAARAVQLAPRQAVTAQWAVLGYALLAPLLLQWLLAELIGGPRRASIGVYLRALALSIARYAAVAAAAACGFWLASELSRRSGPQLELTAGVAPLCGGLVAIAWLATAHDAAQASLAHAPGRGLWRAARQGLRATSWRLIAIHVALWLAGLALFSLGEALARALPWPMLGLIVTQALALGTAFTSAAWLARAAQDVRLRS